MNKLLLKHWFAVFIYAVLAGACIGFGAVASLRIRGTFAGSEVVGTLVFAIGLFTICTRGYNLFTGKVCYLFDNRPGYIIDLIVIWIGNFAGTGLLALMLSFTTLFGSESGINVTASEIIGPKMASPYLSLFLLGILCNIIIYIAVNGYAKNPHEAGKYLIIFLGVSVFILSGSEHCVADMFYWFVSGTFLEYPGESMLRLLIITAGNSVGSVLFPLAEKLHQKLELDCERTDML